MTAVCPLAALPSAGKVWCVKLSDSQRDAIRGLLGAQGELGPSLTGALEALDYARWDDLPEAVLPWEDVTSMAAAQGVDEADVVWDLASGMVPSVERSQAA